MQSQRVALHDGIVVEVTFEQAQTLEALRRDWPRLQPLLARDALELQSNYLGRPPSAAMPAQVWQTMADPAVTCLSDGNYELSCRFTWQAAGDALTVTFFVEDGEPTGSSID